MRRALFVEVAVERVLGAGDEALDDVGLTAHDAVGIARMPALLAPGNVGGGLGPVVGLPDDVDAHGAEAHRRLQYHRQGQIGHVHGIQLLTGNRGVEQPRVQSGEFLAHGRLVLEQTDGISEHGVVNALENPRESVLGIGVHAPGRLGIVGQVQGAAFRHELAREIVGEHRLRRRL